MQFLPAFSTLFLVLTAAVSASPTPVISARQACTTVYPFIQVPVDSSAPDRVYGASSANTIWKNTSGNRNMLIAFELPVEATPETPCRLRFHAVANPPMSISNSPVSVNAYMLTSTVESNTSWNGRPFREGFAGSAGLAVSPIDPADMAIVLQGCRSGAMNYELEMPETGHLNFNSDANNGFYMTYGSGCL